MRRGGGRGFGRRSRRWVSHIPPSFLFNPVGEDGSEPEQVVLSVGEIEALRLVDYLGLTQDEASFKMHVSRKTLWSDLQRARKKVVDALIHGKAIKIEEGNYVLDEER